MTKCIYREVTLNHNKSEDSDTATLEHIIPWAIGGSNGFTTGDASKRANNDFGSEGRWCMDPSSDSRVTV